MKALKPLIFLLALVLIGIPYFWYVRQKPPLNEALRQELLIMEKKDQAIRFEAMEYPDSQEVQEKWKAIDEENEQRMKEIVAQYGWPTIEIVGKDGSSAAWMIVQHAELEFQQLCLPLLKKAVDVGQAEKSDYAYLLDRILIRTGKKQIYGTQLGADLEPLPVENPEKLDELRHEMGLRTIEEYRQQVKKHLGKNRS